MKPTGFERIKLVHEALHKLLGAIKISSLRDEWHNFKIPEIQYPSQHEETIFIQTIAKKVATHYKLNDVTFIISFNSALNAAAEVEIRNADQIFIEYNHAGRINMVDLWPTMAHEIAHIFLNKIGIGYKDTLQNEVLTDTATIVLGFGHCYLSAQRKEVTGLTTSETTYTTKSLGYISPEEMGYILAIRDHIRNDDSLPSIQSDIGMAGYKTGKSRFLDEQKQRPYTRRSSFERMMFKFGWQKCSDIDGYTFPCIVCKQMTRIPGIHKKLIVNCSNCNASITCYS